MRRPGPHPYDIETCHEADEATYASCNTCCDQLFVFLQAQGPDTLRVCTAMPLFADPANVPIQAAEVALPTKFKVQATCICVYIYI